MKTRTSFPLISSLWLRRVCLPSSIGLFLYLLAGLADGTLMPFFALWAQQVAGVSTAYIGFLLACYAGGELLATPMVGGIADRIGRRPVLLISTAGIGAGFLLLSVVHGSLLAAACLIFIGCFESVLHPTIATVIADTVSSDTVRQHFARARVASNIGHIVGPVFGAMLALHSLSSVFLGSACALLLGSLVVTVLLPETWSRDTGASAEDDADESFSSVLPAFRDRRLMALLLGFACLEISGSWIESVLPLYAHDRGLLTPAGVGLLFAYSAGLVVAFQLAVTKALSKLSVLRLVLGSGLVLVIAFVVLLAHPLLWSLIAGMTLFSIAQMLFGPLIPVTVNEIAPPSLRSTYMAAASVMNDVRDTAGPASGMFFYAISAKLPWMLGVPVALLAPLAIFIAKGVRKKPSHASAPDQPGKIRPTVPANKEGVDAAVETRRPKSPLFINYR